MLLWFVLGAIGWAWKGWVGALVVNAAWMVGWFVVTLAIGLRAVVKGKGINDVE